MKTTQIDLIDNQGDLFIAVNGKAVAFRYEDQFDSIEGIARMLKQAFIAAGCPEIHIRLTKGNFEDEKGNLTDFEILKMMIEVDPVLKHLSWQPLILEEFGSASPQWSKENQDLALAKGWGIFDVGSNLCNLNRDRFELQRFDETEVFSEDKEAWRAVVKMAQNGDVLCLEALVFLKANAPNEFQSILSSN